MEIASQFISAHIASIIWIIALFLFGKTLLRYLVHKILLWNARGATGTHMQQRAKTVSSLIGTSGNVVIYVIISLMILGLFDIDIRPILAGAGVVGLAVGFGSQTLVKDVVSGLFILLENQYTVGEEVKLGEFKGVVEKITMRGTALKDKDGNTIFISNSSINAVINFSRKPINLTNVGE